MYQTEKVPQDAIATPIDSINASNFVHLPSIAIFALMGPMTHRANAKVEPRMPIIELNSGKAIETATAKKVVSIRWMAEPNLLKVVWHRI